MAKGEPRSRSIAMEALEGRRLLSGTPNIVGLFSGTYQDTSDSGRGPVSVRVTGQSSRNVIYGTLTVRNQNHKYEYYQFTGSVHGTSVSFTFPDTVQDATGSITGTLTSSATVLSGKFAIGSQDGGTLSAKRQQN